MDPNRQDLLENGRWRLSDDHSRFDRPRAPAGEGVPLSHREREILMPRDGPVRADRLLEQGGAKRDRTWTEDVRYGFSYSRIRGDEPNRGVRREVARTAPPAWDAEWFERSAYLPARRPREWARREGEAVSFEPP